MSLKKRRPETPVNRRYLAGGEREKVAAPTI